MGTRDTDPLADLLPIGAVAATFNVAASTVREWERKGKISALRTPGGQRRYRRSDVEALLAGESVEATG